MKLNSKNDIEVWQLWCKKGLKKYKLLFTEYEDVYSSANIGQ